MKLIFDTPSDFVVQLLGEWLELCHVCKLEEAMCSVENRLRLGPIYGSLVVEGDNYVRNIDIMERQLDWLILRCIRVSGFRVDYPLSRNTLPKVIALLKHSNTHLRNLYLNEVDTSLGSVAVYVSRYCRGVIDLVVSNAILCELFFEMLSNLHHLKELTFCDCDVLDIKDMQGISCSTVQFLSIEGTYPIPIQKNIMKMCPNLVSCELTVDVVELQDMPSTLESLTITQCTSVRIINLNTNLKKLTIVCGTVEDAGLAGMFTSCLYLEELRLSYCESLTNETLKKIADTYNQSLSVLNIKSWDSLSIPAVQYLCEKCTSLKCLTIGGESEDFDPHCIIAALDHSPSLRTLDVSDTVVNDDVLRRVAAAPLESFHMRHATGFTDKGIMALMDGCATLKFLSLYNDSISPLVLYAWKKLRPDLLF